MRTKTLALSALIGMIGSASLMAQSTNVYSLNSVGYINVTMPPGWSIVTCPLIVGTDPTATGSQNPTNTLNVVLNNNSGQYAGAYVFPLINGGYSIEEEGNPFGSGWTGGGADVNMLPGQAIFFYNPNPISGGPSGNMSATFVGTVPQGSLTNSLRAGYSLVGSIVPTSGDLVTNSITAMTFSGSGDFVLFFDPTAHGNTQGGFLTPGSEATYEFGSWGGGSGVNGDPVSSGVSQGFFYYNSQGAVETWVETFSVNP